MTRTRRVGVFLAVVIILYMSSCTGRSNPVPTPNPYAAEFEAARSQTDVPEILAMLSDDVITDGEYHISN